VNPQPTQSGASSSRDAYVLSIGMLCRTVSILIQKAHMATQSKSLPLSPTAYGYQRAFVFQLRFFQANGLRVLRANNFRFRP